MIELHSGYWNVEFKKLPRGVQLNIFTSWLDGIVIQEYINHKWVDSKPSWDLESKYRTKPNKRKA